MSPTVVRTRVVSGPAAIRAAEAVRQDRERRNKWPFEWVFPPADSDRVTAITPNGGVLPPAPGSGNQIAVTTFTVPSGYNFCLTHIVQAFTGQAFNLGDITWSIDKNTPLGVTAVQASVVQGFALLQVPLGSVSPQYSEFPLVRNELFQPEDVIRSKVFVGNNIQGGYFTSIFKGWIWPAVRG